MPSVADEARAAGDDIAWRDRQDSVSWIAPSVGTIALAGYSRGS